MPEYYDHTTYPSNGSHGSSSAMRSELNSIELGFDKLPTMAGNGGEIVAVNSGGTALEAITTTGTGSGVRATSPTFVTPILGTPTSGTLTNCTGLPAGGLIATATDKLFGRSTAGAGVGEEITCTAAARSILDDATVSAMVDTLGGAASTGSGGLVRITSPTFATSVIGSASMDVFNTVSTTVNAFGAATALSLGAATGTLTLNNAAVSFKAGAVGTPSIYLGGDTTSGMYRIAANEIGVAISGVERGHWSSTGLQVTGGISGTSLNVSDTITSTKTGSVFANTGASTSVKYFGIANTGGAFYVGVNNSVGASIFSNDAAYSTSIGTSGATAFNVATNNVVRTVWASDGSISHTGAISATTSILSSGATHGIGYTTGAGGTVAQGAGSGKATGVTLAKVCGTITLDNANLAADTTVTFLLTMTGFTLNTTDQFVLSHISVGTFGAYTLNARYASATTMNVDVHNSTPGALAEAIVIQYSLIRSVAA